MLYVRDKGQMCNNILQYAHVYAWGREHNRETMSMRFAYKYQYFRICHTRYHNFFRYVSAKLAAQVGLLPVIEFPFEKGQDTTRQEAQMMKHKNAVVEGWRVEFFDLFLKYRWEITELFNFNETVEQAAAQKMAACMGKGGSRTMGDSVNLGVHIRRGDYIRHLGGRFFYDDSVYLEVIRQFSGMYPGKHINVFICGNDPELYRGRYIDGLSDMTVCFPGGNPGEDLCLLSHCDYLVGPPSSFSLVAAMYRDIPLYWIMDADIKSGPLSFKYFDELFRNIL